MHNNLNNLNIDEINDVVIENIKRIIKSKNKINEDNTSNTDNQQNTNTILEMSFAENKKELIDNLKYALNLIMYNNRTEDALKILLDVLDWCTNKLKIEDNQNQNNNQTNTNNNQGNNSNNNSSNEQVANGVLYASFTDNNGHFREVSTKRGSNSIIKIVTQDGVNGLYQTLTDKQAIDTMSLVVEHLKIAFNIVNSNIRPQHVENIKNGTAIYKKGKWYCNNKGEIRFL